MNPRHTIDHALGLVACTCERHHMRRCVICSRALRPDRLTVDTCGLACSRTLLRRQREHMNPFQKGRKPWLVN